MKRNAFDFRLDVPIKQYISLFYIAGGDFCVVFWQM